MRYVSRKDWRARAPKGRTPQSPTKDSTLFVHYSAGQGRGIESRKEQAAAMRSIQSYHQNTQGWSDIGYSYVVFQPYGKLKLARLFAGRGFGTVPAAQSGYNTGNGAVCVVAEPGEKLKWQTRRLLKKVYRRFEGQNLRGHRDVGQTSCPGDEIYKYLLGIRRASGKVQERLP